MPQSREFSDHSAIFGTRFKVVRSLKKGQGIETLLGHDLDTDSPVVIKTVSPETSSSGKELRLVREAEALSGIKSRHLASLLHYGKEMGQFYLVMPFFEGQTLAQRLEEGPIPWKEVLDIAIGIFSGLGDLHELGLVHRDIKPMNLMLVPGNGTGKFQALLIDFGLATRSQEPTTASRNLPEGTALYVSPEQAGLLDRTVDARSDLYSAGVVLYECLAGAPPFRGEDIGDVLRQHLSSPPKALHSIKPNIPPALNEIILRLLKKDPSDRYQSAKAVISDLTKAAHAARSGNELRVTPGMEDKRSTLTDPSFVGRDAEISRLGEIADESQQGRGSIVTIEALSGGGKSRLIHELVHHRAGRKERVFFGQGIDEAAPHPYQILNGIIEGVLSSAKSEPQYIAQVSSRLGQDLPDLCSVFPDLKEVFATSGQSRGPTGPEGFGEIRSLRAITSLLTSLGTPERPALVVLDDCQWADELTFKLLSQWNDRGAKNGNQRFVTLVVAYRSEAVGDRHPLRKLPSALRLNLEPLSNDQISQMLKSMAGPLPSEVTDLVTQLAEGNPFMASATIWGLLESGALLAQSSGWALDSRLVADLQTSRKAAALLSRRFSSLPPETLNILKVGALLGKKFDSGLVAALLGQSPRAIDGILEEARRRQIIWKRSDIAYDFLHDKLRESLLEQLLPEERTRLHLTAAQKIEEVNPRRVFELAYHFDEAHEHAKALPYAIAAAEEASYRHSLEIAEKQYCIAERGLSGADQAVRLRVNKGLGSVLMMRGKYDEAVAQFEKAGTNVTNPFEEAQIDALKGELHFKRGDVTSASRALEHALRQMGYFVPKSLVMASLGLLRELTIQCLHSLFPKLFERRRPLDGRSRDSLAIRILSRLAYVYWFKQGNVYCGWAHLREMNLTEGFAPSLEMAQAYSEHAPVMTLIPYFSRGIRYVERSLQIRKKLGDYWGEGQSLHFYGVILYAASRFQECIEKCREAVRILERTGDRWEVNTANWHIAYSLYRQGKLEEAAALGHQVHSEAIRIGDRQAAAISLSVWTLASNGNIDETLVTDLLREVGDDAVSLTILLLSRGVFSLRGGRIEQAIELLQQAWQVIDDKRLDQEYVAPILPWLTTALRLNLSYQSAHPFNHHRTMKLALETASKARRISLKYKNSLPHVLREQAILFALAGGEKRSKQLFASSLQLAESQGAKYEHARTLLARGSAGLELGWPQADQDLADGKKAIAQLSQHFPVDFPWLDNRDEMSVTLSLADRYDKLLSFGRRVATSQDRASVFSTLQEAAAQLLHAENCLILEEDKREIRVLSGDPKSAFSRNILLHALHKKKTIIVTEGAATSPSDSMVLGGIRSVLCAPILVRNQSPLALYITHREIKNLFGEEEERIAQFIITAAGAALENISGIEVIRHNAERLAQSNFELERFAFIASHDLQEPLRMMSLYSQRLSSQLHGKTDESSGRTLESIIAASKRMHQLIKDLLAYSSISAESEPFQRVDCEAVLTQAMLNLRPVLEESGTVLTHDSLPSVDGNQSQIVLLFENLIGNSIKFRRNEPPKISIKVKASDQEWIFEVEDNGIGFDEKLADNVFVLFRRLHTQEQFPGTGTGLALCKRIVERHGGKIWALSTPGKGTVIYFSLPVSHALRSEEVNAAAGGAGGIAA